MNFLKNGLEYINLDHVSSIEMDNIEDDRFPGICALTFYFQNGSRFYLNLNEEDLEKLESLILIK